MAEADDERKRKWGLALHAARTQAGLSQTDLAHRIRCAQANVSNWERGRNAPPPEDVFALEDILGVAPGGLSHLLGYVPVAAGAPECTVRRAIIEDENLDGKKRRALLAMYEVLAAG